MRLQAAAALLPLLAAALLAGCSAPDRELPGVRTDTRVADTFSCGALLVPQGCTIVRLPRAESGCSPEAGGYVVCNSTIEWTATSGAVVPGSTLIVRVGGEDAGTCRPTPGEMCVLRGNATYERSFSGPGQQDVWAVDFVAVLASPRRVPHTEGTFSLAVEMTTRTEDGSKALE